MRDVSIFATKLTISLITLTRYGVAFNFRVDCCTPGHCPGGLASVSNYLGGLASASIVMNNKLQRSQSIPKLQRLIEDSVIKSESSNIQASEISSKAFKDSSTTMAFLERTNTSNYLTSVDVVYAQQGSPRSSFLSRCYDFGIKRAVKLVILALLFSEGLAYTGAFKVQERVRQERRLYQTVIRFAQFGRNCKLWWMDRRRSGRVRKILDRTIQQQGINVIEFLHNKYQKIPERKQSVGVIGTEYFDRFFIQAIKMLCVCCLCIISDNPHFLDFMGTMTGNWNVFRYHV